MPLDADALADVVVSTIQRALAPVLTDVKTLQALVATLEARGAVMGRDGRDGKDGVAIVGPQGPQGEKGTDGAIGLAGAQGPQGERGADGRNGTDGQSVTGPQGDKGADGAPGLHGKDGANGRDGLNGTLDNLKAVQGADLRTFSLCFKATGEPIEGGTFTLPVVLDRGVYKAGTTYQAGDGVTWAGSFWIAQAETDAKPGEGATPWRLAVKAGREGKAGRDGRDLRDAPVVSLRGRE